VALGLKMPPGPLQAELDKQAVVRQGWGTLRAAVLGECHLGHRLQHRCTGSRGEDGGRAAMTL
jgi:hypothetical protein